MTTSIVTDAGFRALLTRKGGALGSELQAYRERAFVYSTWSLRCMEVEGKWELWTQKEGKQTRYMLKRVKKAADAAANVGRKARKSANANAAADAAATA